jgi:Holliday junction resolvase RusA-like endonuclease
MSKLLKIVYPVLPPSSNKIYFRGTILRQEARNYAENFAKYAAQNHLHEISLLNPQGVYALHLKFFFDSLVNETWNNHTLAPSRRAKSRYKRIDLTNRIKLLEDCVRDAIDIDDSQTFAASQEKHQDPNNPRVEIEIEEISPALFGI